MLRVGIGILCAVVLSATCGAPPEPDLTPEHAKATAASDARAALPLFLAHLSAHPSDAAAWLTIQMPPEGAERPQAELTLRTIVPTGASTFSGVISKPDPNWPEFTAGSTMSFPASIVIDWVFYNDRKLVGAYQLRAKMCLASQSLQGLPEKIAEQVRTEAKAAAFLLDEKKACAPYDAEKDVEGAAK